jgi:hypothetical protein
MNLRHLMPSLFALAACAAGEGTSTGTAEAESTDDAAMDDAAVEDDGADFVTKFDMLAPDLGPADSHAEDMQPIWSQSCVIYCHSAGMEPPAAELDLTTDSAYDDIVNQPSVQLPTMMLVAPGDPDQSYLWHKLLGTHLDVGGEGDPMPANLQMLDQDRLDRIEAWILAGAPP